MIANEFPVRKPGAPPTMDIASLSKALRNGALSSVEVVAGYLERIREQDGRLMAFLALYGDEAMARAAEMDKLLQAGTWLGPLHGIPVAIKDAIDIEGKPTTFGSPSFPARPALRSAALVRKLNAAGAVMIGKTHLVPFALGAWGINQEMGTPRNPWDHATHRAPGGSSSGSAVAVAADFAPLAIGTDTGGSVRVPAAFCGITGFKPSTQAINIDGVKPLSGTLDSVGIFTRSAQDCAIVFDVLRRDQPAATQSLQDMGSLKGLRLGRLGAADLAGTSAAVRDAYEAAIEIMRIDGARVETATLPASFTEFAVITNTIILAEGALEYGAMARDEAQPMDGTVRQRLLAGTRIGSAEYLAALETRATWIATYTAATQHFDAVLIPTTPDTATELSIVDPQDPPIRYTRMLNLLDLDAVSVPNGFDARGLPTGLQITGKFLHSDKVLAIAHRFQTLTHWHERRPAPCPEK